MKEINCNAKTIAIVGRILSGLGVFLFLQNQYLIFFSSTPRPLDGGVILGIAALLAIGFTTVMIAKCLKKIEQKLYEADS